MNKILFVAVFLGYNLYGLVYGFVDFFYVQEHPKAQPAVVMILKRLMGWKHS